MHIFGGERDRTQKVEDRRQAYLERQRWTDRTISGNQIIAKDDKRKILRDRNT